MLSYFALGTEHKVQLRPLSELSAQPRFLGPGPLAAIRRVVESSPAVIECITRSPLLRTRAFAADQLAVVQGTVAARPARGARSAGQLTISSPSTITLATPTVIAEGMRTDDFAAAKAYGAEVIEEALDGKLL